jgi:hypothetical protein
MNDGRGLPNVPPELYLWDTGNKHHAVEIMVNNPGLLQLIQLLMACACIKWQIEAILLHLFEQVLSQTMLAGAALKVQSLTTKKETSKAEGTSRLKTTLKSVPLPKARILLLLKTAADVDVMIRYGRPLEVVFQQL